MKKARKIFWGLLTFSMAEMARGQAPHPGEVHINRIVHNGTGCPIGSVAGLIASDAQAFSLLFSEYTAEAGPGLPLAAGRKNCQLLIDLHIPQGWQYSVLQIDTRGYVDLDRGVIADISTGFYFQGEVGPNFRDSIVGAAAGDYIKSDVVGIESVVWSPCGTSKLLNVRSSVSVRARGWAQGLATVDSIDGSFTQVFGLRWRRCRI